MAYKLEMLNLVFKKFHSRVGFDQTKEKFGRFCGYYTIHPTDHILFKILTWPLRRLRSLLEHKIKYCESRDVIVPRHDIERYVELDPAKSTDGLLDVVEVAGKRYGIECHTFHGVTEVVPRKHKLLWKVKELVRSADIKFQELVSFTNQESACDVVARQALDAIVQKIVDECEHECDRHCISCGAWIGDSYSHRFQTRGWITYVCSRCARRLERDPIDVTASKATEDQLAFERKLKKAMSECGIAGAISSGSGESLQKALEKLGDEKAIETQLRKLDLDAHNYDED